jgi:hypothetical protein
VKKADVNHSARTMSGFEFGAATVEAFTHDKRGNVIGVTTPRDSLQVFVTPTGKIRLFLNGAEVTRRPEGR